VAGGVVAIFVAALVVAIVAAARRARRARRAQAEARGGEVECEEGASTGATEGEGETATAAATVARSSSSSTLELAEMRSAGEVQRLYEALETQHHMRAIATPCE
jgi:hypothetical protein